MFEPKKQCSRCRQWKGHQDFSYRRHTSDRMDSWCKACKQIVELERRAANPESVAEVNRRRRLDLTIYKIRKRCAETGLPFDLDQHVPELKARWAKQTCELSGIPLQSGFGKQEINSPSIDRIYPWEGYVYSNVRIIAFGLNALFGAWGEARAERLVRAWLDRRT